jgi:hypothetical protein
MTSMHGQQARIPRPEPKPSPGDAPPQPAADWRQDQAARYMEAAYGPDWLHKVPESLSPHGQWIRAVASGERESGEKSLAKVKAQLEWRPGVE